MEKKPFKSKLFNRIIHISEAEYWNLLYAELLFRLRVITDLNCKCALCFSDRVRLDCIIGLMIKDKHIKANPGSENVSGHGECRRKVPDYETLLRSDRFPDS